MYIVHPFTSNHTWFHHWSELINDGYWQRKKMLCFRSPAYPVLYQPYNLFIFFFRFYKNRWSTIYVHVYIKLWHCIQRSLLPTSIKEDLGTGNRTILLAKVLPGQLSDRWWYIIKNRRISFWMYTVFIIKFLIWKFYVWQICFIFVHRWFYYAYKQFTLFRKIISKCWSIFEQNLYMKDACIVNFVPRFYWSTKHAVLFFLATDCLNWINIKFIFIFMWSKQNYA
jgi:hypothetical protein